MRAPIAVALMLCCAAGSEGQESRRFDPKSSYSVFAEYSNDSSHILLGQSENRRLFAAGAVYSRRLAGTSIYSWHYQVEIIPILFLQDPLLTTDINVAAIPSVSPIEVAGLSPGSYHFSDLQARECSNSSGSGDFFGTLNSGEPPVAVETFTYSSICSRPWTYGGGVSPLGQKVNFATRSKLQPYVAVNAGFVAFAKTVPSDNATMFNFSFEFGGGLEWVAGARRGWALDYRYHHISNAWRGMENPGVDNGTLRLSYSFWR
jgi:hypothetical protein